MRSKRPSSTTGVNLWGVEEGNGREPVEICVLAEEFLRQWVVIAGGDVCTTLLQNEAGEANPTTDLENMLARDRKPSHLFGQREASWPHEAKHRPGGGRDSDPLGAAVWVGELLPIAKGPNLIRSRPDLIAGRLDLVPSCSRIHVRASIAPSAEVAYTFRGLLLWSGRLRGSGIPLTGAV